MAAPATITITTECRFAFGCRAGRIAFGYGAKLRRAAFMLLFVGLATLLASPSRASDAWKDAVTWFPHVPRVSATALTAIGDDLRALYRVQGKTLSIHTLETGRVKKVALPGARWTSLHLAPPTDGEIERAVLVARDKGGGRLVLVHLRTGRVIGDWTSPVQVPAGDHETSVHWAPDGLRFFAVGWPLDGPGVPGELAMRQVESTLGTIVARIDVPELLPVQSAALLSDGRTVALGTDKRLVLLGPGPIDAKTFAVPSGSRLVGATSDGLVLWRHDRLLLVETGQGARAVVLAELSADGLTDRVTTHPRGRFGLAWTSSGALLLDARKQSLSPLPAHGIWPAVLRDRLVFSERGRLGIADLWRWAP